MNSYGLETFSLKVSYLLRYQKFMKQNILLINPWIHDFAAFNLWVKPLGLLYIGAALKHAGYNVEMIDCLHYNIGIKGNRPYGTGHFFSQEIEKPSIFRNVPRRFKRYGMPLEKFRNILKTKNTPLLICVTSHMTYWYPGVLEAIKIVKEIFPSTPVVLGGIYATLCHEHAKSHSGADYIINGPGELQVLKLADQLAHVRREYEPIEEDLKHEISPAYELYDKLESVSIITSRGCPFSCTYCASSILNNEFVFRKPEVVTAEIQRFVETLGVKEIAFYDDALFVNPRKHIIPILKSLINNNRNTTFHTPNGLHPRYINNELTDLLYMAGFRTLRLSFEGVSNAIQDASCNKVNNHHLENALDCIKKTWQSVRRKHIDPEPWKVGIYILIGLPDQKIEDVKESINYINKIGGQTRITEYSPVPGTKEFEKALKLYPEIETEPLAHNKSTFTTIGMDIDFKEYYNLKNMANKLNLNAKKEQEANL